VRKTSKAEYEREQDEIEAMMEELKSSIKMALFDLYDRCISRERLKTLVQSGRLTKFLQVIKASLEAKTDEYAKVSEIAEKLVSVLS
jgi:hypothetical protein